MTLSQRLLVADAHRMILDEGADRIVVGSSDVDFRPTIYHPGGIFEELSPLPPELLHDPRAQSWGNVKRFGAQEYLEKIFDSLRSYTVIKEAVETVYALLEEHNPVLSDFSFTTIEEGSKVESNAEASQNVLTATIPYLSAIYIYGVFKSSEEENEKCLNGIQSTRVKKSEIG
ncbi:hypothetical protein DY000_02009852 [Brassica cretica]|uniref:RRP12 N-terminal HEAT domain-containing protein n=1 Tax=Brassica cretica TaxID=69181 RepID=A0ABQ7BUD4_BRACR|nr:hypothetical protein DY000_02009852 [Brassica cretica]